ncbi:unnamed protein product [Diabrotica balteata]|uniref:Peptidase M13 N-terminal domain-containing protein n=1 Tax=Diabrotica balteata TaxID=107213 RepID=A0A9N9X6F2_DIABA|nr:unnamed protein product [Diabrotica balteata]
MLYYHHLLQGGRWTQESLSQAITNVLSGQMSAYQASKDYQILRSTLILNTKRWGEKKTSTSTKNSGSGGKSPAISAIYEERLVKYLIDSNCPRTPLSIKRYDQADLLQEDEDRREILKDIKTIFAPEYRVYTNDSICSTVTKRKRTSNYCRDDLFKEYDPRRDFFSKSSRKGFCEENYLYRSRSKKQLQEDDDMYSELSSNYTLLHREDPNEENFYLSKNNIAVDSIHNLVTGELLNVKNATIQTETKENKHLKEDSDVNEEEIRNEIWPIWYSNLSTTEIRALQSKIMKKFMNPQVDPCVDFYEYACGNWKNYYSIPPDRSTYDIFEMVKYFF